jgi:hypothetical protein
VKRLNLLGRSGLRARRRPPDADSPYRPRYERARGRAHHRPQPQLLDVVVDFGGAL